MSLRGLAFGLALLCAVLVLFLGSAEAQDDKPIVAVAATTKFGPAPNGAHIGTTRDTDHVPLLPYCLS